MADLRVDVEGHPGRYLDVDLLCRCGSIENGVGFEHVGDRHEGGWVISFHDLQRIYNAALTARKGGSDE